VPHEGGKLKSKNEGKETLLSSKSKQRLEQCFKVNDKRERSREKNSLLPLTDEACPKIVDSRDLKTQNSGEQKRNSAVDMARERGKGR